METYWIFAHFPPQIHFKPSPEITEAKAMDTIFDKICKMQLLFSEVDLAGISKDEIKDLHCPAFAFPKYWSTK